MTPARRLAEALSRLDDSELTALADRAGVSHQAITKAANGSRAHPCPVKHYVRILSALDVAPFEDARQPAGVLDFDAGSFARAFTMARLAKGHDLRAAAKASGLSLSVVARISHCDPRSIDSVLTACRYAGLDPRLYAVPVSRETPGNNPAQSRSAA